MRTYLNDLLVSKLLQEKPQQTNTMTLAELNNIAQEIANKLGHISQELLLEVHALIHKDEAPTPVAPTPHASE